MRPLNSLIECLNRMLPNHTLTKPSKRMFSLLALIACMSYLFVRFFPKLRPLATGLDPSWVYALNDAADQGLTFGKDIIFTFGPFGYLLNATVFKDHTWLTFSFLLLLHSSLLILTLLKIHRLKNFLQKITLLLSLFAFYLLGGGTGIEYQVLLTLFTLLSSDRLFDAKHSRRHAVFLGIFAGFALLTKFTVSVCSFAPILILLFFNLYQAIKARSQRETALLAMTDFLLASGTVSFILLNPNRLQGLAYVGLCLAAAGVAVLIKQLAVPAFLQWRSRPKTSPTEEGRWEQITTRKSSQYLFYLTYLISLALFILFASPSLLAYLKGSLEFSSGYSSAMGIAGDVQHLRFSISMMLLILAFLASGLRRNDLGFSLSLAVLLFIAFKHGFVRQDAHALTFFSVAPWIVAMQISRMRSSRGIKVASVLFGTILVVSFWASSLFIPHLNSAQQFFEFLSPKAAMGNLANVIKFDQYQADLKKRSEENLKQRQLPSAIRNVIGNKPVDIIPWEAAIAAANDINWQPRPVFQSYAAYTAYLDNANFESFSKSPREYLLYSFMSIDGRHPFFDEPKTFRYLFCHYKASNQLPNFISLGSKTETLKITLLEKQKASLCLPDTSEQTLSLKWRETSLLPENGLTTYASIKFHYTLLGKLYKTLFKVPPIRIRVTYANGSIAIYRVVPDNAENGLLLTYLPKDQTEAIALFNGHSPTSVKAFQLFNNNPLVFQPHIELKLASFPMEPSKWQKPFDLSNLQRTTFISQAGSNFFGHIDAAQLNESSFYNNTLNVAGWALAKNSASSHWVILTLGTERKILGFMKTGVARPDVADALKSENNQNSGWSGILDVANLPGGQYPLDAWIYDGFSDTATHIDQRQVILP